MSTGERNARDGLGHAALFAVQVFFALFPIFGKWTFEPGGFTPRSLGAWRMLFGAATLGAVAFAVHRRRAIPAARDLGLLFAGSLLGVVFNMLLYLEGLARSTPTNASILMCLIPVFTFVIAAAVKQETFSGLRTIGVLLALFGASMRFWYVDDALTSEHVLGNALMALNALSYSAYFVLTRPLARRYPPLVVIAWVFLFSALAAPLMLVGETLTPDGASERAWWSLAFVLVFPTSLAYLFNVFALSRLSASTTAIYIYFQPFITAAASVWLVGEHLTPAMGVSAAFVFAGVWLVARRPKQAEIGERDGAPARP